MDDDPADRSGTRGTPLEPCIWMSAGLVAYKLCELDYECDRCRFDAVMRNERRTKSGARRSAAAFGHRVPSFPDDRLYHERHVWIRPDSPDRPGLFRLGIDAFAAWLIGAVESVIAPARGARLERGGPACWLCGALGMFSARSPVDGVLVTVNPALKEIPRLAAEDPYEGGWLIEAAAPQAEGTLASLQTSAEMNALARAQMIEAKQIIAAEARRAHAKVGVTLPDGGEPVSDWRSSMTRDHARRIVRRYLG
jgi:glycine cleavage system H lipoate-binding protein